MVFCRETFLSYGYGKHIQRVMWLSWWFYELKYFLARIMQIHSTILMYGNLKCRRRNPRKYELIRKFKNSHRKRRREDVRTRARQIQDSSKYNIKVTTKLLNLKTWYYCELYSYYFITKLSSTIRCYYVANIGVYINANVKWFATLLKCAGLRRLTINDRLLDDEVGDQKRKQWHNDRRTDDCAKP